MGECADCWKSSEELAIERIARRRMAAADLGPGTEYTDRLAFEHFKQEVTDEFILMNGRSPKDIWQ